MAKLLYQRRPFNKRLSIVRLEFLRSICSVALGKFKRRKSSKTIGHEECNFIEQLQEIDNINDLNPLNPNHFIFPDEVPLYRRVNELNVWQGSCPTTLNCAEDYKRSVRLAKANLVSIISGAMSMLEDKPCRTVSKQLRKIASTAESLACNTLSDFEKICNDYAIGNGMCKNEEIEAEWGKIQQKLTEVYFNFDVIESQL
eukprot:TRINITY_DN12162_c0_g1_i1.p1 TRINITY_DN12162_c0_g1~~TRINITY_DN12162_c0_g1_i1.p1  ORF type:complete len:207 (-),score=7.80 TRINITY_DN12162_c0_g1_i1:69-668(-)